MSNNYRVNRRAFVRTALAAVGAVTMSEADAGLFDKMLETRPPFPVTTSELVFGKVLGSIAPVFWLDNDRALLPAQKVDRHKGADGRDVLSASAMGIYIWDIPHNTYTRYADLMAVPRLFQYDHGNIAYAISRSKDDNTSVVMIGKMGEEKSVILKDWADARLEPSKGPHLTSHRDTPETYIHYCALLPQHGYIQVSRIVAGADSPISHDNQNDRVKFYRPRNISPVDLPILAKKWVTTRGVVILSMWVNMYWYPICLSEAIILAPDPLVGGRVATPSLST